MFSQGACSPAGLTSSTHGSTSNRSPAESMIPTMTKNKPSTRTLGTDVTAYQQPEAVPSPRYVIVTTQAIPSRRTGTPVHVSSSIPVTRLSCRPRHESPTCVGGTPSGASDSGNGWSVPLSNSSTSNAGPSRLDQAENVMMMQIPSISGTFTSPFSACRV